MKIDLDRLKINRDRLKTRSWLILGLLVLVLVAGIGLIGSNALGKSNNIGITVQTNGTDVSIKTNAYPWSNVPKQMLDEIKETSLKDIQDPNSNVTSIKSDITTIAKKYNCTVDVTIASQFGTDQLPMPASVSGTSMNPTLQDGQNIIVLKTKDFKVGDIVVAIHPDYDMIVKRVDKIEGSKVFLKSDNRKTEVKTTETQLSNGEVAVETVTKTPVDTWLPKENVIGVVKIY